MGDIVFSDQPKTLKEEVINDDIKFTDQPVKSKVSKTDFCSWLFLPFLAK